MKFIKTLPIYSELDGDFLDVGAWESEENICELQEDKRCLKNNIEYFGTTDSREPKFCFKHFIVDVVSGDGKTNYKLISEKEMKKKVKLLQSKSNTETIFRLF